MLQAKVEFDGAKLKEGIQAVLKLAAPYTGIVNITISEDEFLIESRAELSIAFVKVPFESITLEVDAPVRFGLSLDQLRLIVGNRKGKITLALENVALKIAATNYRAELITSDYVEYPKVVKQTSDTLDIDQAQSQWLEQSISSVALKPNLISPIMPVTVHADKSGIVVSCYSRDHLIFIKSKKITGQIDFSIPIESFSSVFSVFSKSNFKITSSDSYFYAENDLYRVYISLPATEAYLSTDVLLPRLDAFLESEGIEIVLDYKDLSSFFASMKAVVMSERPELTISSDKNKTVLECSTSLGNIKYACKGLDTSINLKIDAEYLKEMIAKTDKKEVKIKCCQESGFVLIPLKNNAYSVIALNS